MKILIADDDLYHNKLLQMQLSKWDYDIVSVQNGQEALDILSEPEGPKLAILDWMMPQMDGITVCREIRGKSN
ncbi:response regulator transcription factor, partial [candidate division KSB1 bacterium]|nr:response regulator transcription factor [candidate division KSB1 bacterium]